MSDGLFGAFNGRSIVRRLKLPVVDKLLYAGGGFIAEGAGPRRYHDLFVARRKRRVECEFTSDRAEILGKKSPVRRIDDGPGRASVHLRRLLFYDFTARPIRFALFFFSKKSLVPPFVRGDKYGIIRPKLLPRNARNIENALHEDLKLARGAEGSLGRERSTDCAQTDSLCTDGLSMREGDIFVL